MPKTGQSYDPNRRSCDYSQYSEADNNNRLLEHDRIRVQTIRAEKRQYTGKVKCWGQTVSIRGTCRESTYRPVSQEQFRLPTELDQLLPRRPSGETQEENARLSSRWPTTWALKSSVRSSPISRRLSRPGIWLPQPANASEAASEMQQLDQGAARKCGLLIRRRLTPEKPKRRRYLSHSRGSDRESVR